MSTYFAEFQEMLDRLKTVDPGKSSHVCECTEETGLSDHCKKTLNLHLCGYHNYKCDFCDATSVLVENHINEECNACSGASHLRAQVGISLQLCWWCCPSTMYDDIWNTKDEIHNPHRTVRYCISKAKAVYKSLCGLHPSICDDHIAVDCMETVAAYIEKHCLAYKGVYPDHSKYLYAPRGFVTRSKEFDRAVKYLQAERDKQYQESGIVFEQAKTDYETRDTGAKSTQATPTKSTKKRRRKQSASTDQDN